MAADPATFFITEHYRNNPSALARLGQLEPGDMRKLLARAIELPQAKTRTRQLSILMLLSLTTLVQRSVSNFSFSR
jgi:hypothetical protein